MKGKFQENGKQQTVEIIMRYKKLTETALTTFVQTVNKGNNKFTRSQDGLVPTSQTRGISKKIQHSRSFTDNTELLLNIVQSTIHRYT